jgi:hypothetical protein
MFQLLAARLRIRLQSKTHSPIAPALALVMQAMQLLWVYLMLLYWYLMMTKKNLALW